VEPGVNGLLVPADDVEALAAAVLERNLLRRTLLKTLPQAMLALILAQNPRQRQQQHQQPPLERLPPL
jgi:hypothetical protein